MAQTRAAASSATGSRRPKHRRDRAGFQPRMLADQHIVQHRQVVEQADILERPGNALRAGSCAAEGQAGFCRRS